jgi:AraC-like DNA-binding protein
MNGPAAHFPPMTARSSRSTAAGAPTVVSVAALAGVSEWVRHNFGDRVLEQANRAAMLDIETIEDQDCFIPHATMNSFLAEIERQTGARDFGLLIAPHLSLARYGRWGAYVLDGDTLGEALARASATIGYHSRGDRIELSVAGERARAGYVNAARGQPGYVHVAAGTAGVLLSLFRRYLPPEWRPRAMELDVPRPHNAVAFEAVFACPLIFDASAVAIRFDASLLDCRAIRRGSPRRVTLGDLARARLTPASLESFRGVVVAQIWAQVLAGAVSIDSTAIALGMSIRTLQRALHRERTDFRELTNSVRLQRAKELLAETPAPVIEISNLLGYSAPANFARAFRRATGSTPQQFRASLSPLRDAGS